MGQALSLAVWAPPAAAAAGLVLSLLVDAFDRRRPALWLAALGLGVAAGLCFALAGGSDSPVAVRVLLSGGGFTALPGVGYALAACAVIAGHDRLANLDRGVATAGLISLGAVFSHALLACLDMRVLLVAMAGCAIVAYALVAGGGGRRAEEAAIRYFIQGTVASGLTVYGLAILYGLAGGSPGYLEAGVALGAAAGRPAVIGLGLVVSAFAFKLGAFPFHSWVPDAYETGDASDIAFLASVPKAAALVALLVTVQGTLFASEGFGSVKGLLVALAVASLVFGALGMVRQRSVARLLGYSAIAQVGYGLAAIGSAQGGVLATMTFAMTYALGVAVAFISLEAIPRVLPGWDGSIAGLAGLSRRSPVVAASLAISMLSLTGMPLLAGFWGKLLVFVALVGSDMVWVAVVAGLAAVVSFAGYGSVIRWIYFEAEPENGEHAEELGGEGMPSAGRAQVGTAQVVAAALAICVVAAGCLPLAYGIEPVAALLGLG